ncbi:hypothetical protein ACFVWN_23685, partial [Nocardiopsis flavescens]
GTTVRAPRVSGPVVAGDAEVPVTVVPDPQAPPAGPAPRPEREEPAGSAGTVWVPEIGPEEPPAAVMAADSGAAGTRLRTQPRTAPAPRGGAE